MPWLHFGDEGRSVAAKTPGKCRATFDPEVSEWGNPHTVICVNVTA